MQVISVMGFVFSLIGFAMALRLTYVRVVYANFDNMQMVMALMFFLAGVQMLCTSVLCEYISRIYVEVQNRPYYIIGEILE